MALTYEHVQLLADKLAVMARRTIELHDDIQSLVAENAAVGIDWAASPLPEIMVVDPATGNILGKRFSPADVAGAKDVLNAVRQAMETGNTFIPALFKIAE